ncbi:MAG: hypothetical protein GYA17_10680 [Chloroflexi bacterium]|nr:hypothetical protein [Anaerolineaceae bacterium]NMB88816.1 hypothetical protein [Chloroflexota bacterium]
MPFPMFDRSKLLIKPLDQRIHDLTIDVIKPLDAPVEPFDNPDLDTIAERIVAARRAGAAVIMLMGAHVIRRGNSNYIIDLMQRKLITHVGFNGAGVVHDYEFARIGATTESVPRYISAGQFGLWKETGEINDAVVQGYHDGLGLGETMGRAIEEGKFPYRQSSILAAGYRLQVPVTVHVALGQDILHEHPNMNGAAYGETSYRDFLIFTQSVTNLQHGVFLNYGTQVMGPEVYLKALAMSRNVAHQEGRRINEFTTAVFDLIDLGEDTHSEAPKTQAQYYFRPYKTILVRTVQDGGQSFYIRGDHSVTFPNLYHHILKKWE